VGQGNLSPVPKRVGTDSSGKPVWDWRNPRLVHSNAKQLKPWRQEMANAAIEARAEHPVIPRDVAVRVSACFYFPRLASAPKRVTRHTKAPDTDKLIRSFDALSGICWVDDSQVDEWHVWKRFAGGPSDPLGAQGSPRCVVEIAAQDEIRQAEGTLFEEDEPAPQRPLVVAKARVRKPRPDRPEVGF
jgi:Holliday junction resolvase RusA-like endonuclease